MDFGDALRALKDGRKVRRQGWDIEGTWLCLMPPATIPEGLVNARTKAFWPTGDLLVGGYIVMRTAHAWRPGWVPSQADMLNEDWRIED